MIKSIRDMFTGAACFLAGLLIVCSAGITCARASNEAYVVMEYNGSVAVFTFPDLSTPAEITDIRVNTLPGKDIDSLKKGIAVLSDESLFRLLEDFSS